MRCSASFMTLARSTHHDQAPLPLLELSSGDEESDDGEALLMLKSSSYRRHTSASRTVRLYRLIWSPCIRSRLSASMTLPPIIPLIWRKLFGVSDGCLSCSSVQESLHFELECQTSTVAVLAIYENFSSRKDSLHGAELICHHASYDREDTPLVQC